MIREVVTESNGNVTPSGNVDVSAGPGDCTVTLTPGPNGAGVGNCNIADLAAGYYTVTAAYQGSAAFSPSNAQATVTIGGAPTFVAASPPLTATAGQGYSYTFQAKAFPPPSYALGSGSPGCWHRGHRFTVKVVGFAASYGDWWIPGQRESYSVAYVTIIPRGWWAG